MWWVTIFQVVLSVHVMFVVYANIFEITSWRIILSICKNSAIITLNFVNKVHRAFDDEQSKKMIYYLLFDVYCSNFRDFGALS